MMDRKAPLIVLLAVVAMVILMAVSLSMTSAAPSPALPNLPPPPTSEKPPTVAPKPTSGGGGGGSSSGGGGNRFLHCNSTVDGFVTDYGSMIPGSGVLVEVGGGGWKNQIPADDNGYFAFRGLCQGTAYVRVIVPPGSLLTNPNAEIVLDGKNQVRVEQGFFLPRPQAASASGDTKPAPVPLVASDSIQQVVPVAPQPQLVPVVPLNLPKGVTVNLSAPRSVRAGMDAQINISVQNGGPGNATGVVLRLPLAEGIKLQEADTSRGALKMNIVPQVLGKVGGFAAPASASASELVVDVGVLPAGDVLLVATKIRFKDTAPPGSQAQMQAQVWSAGTSYRSDVAVITLEEAGSLFQITLPTTGGDDYLRHFHDLLW